jgi:hypothetical protein
MRFKNFTLLFLMGIFGLFTTNLFAQQDASIDPDQIRYWIGEGENQAVFIVNWNEPDTALAWGYRFNGDNVTVKQMMEDIRDVDYRFGFGFHENLVDDIFYEESDGLALHLTSGGFWMFVVNGEMSWDYFDAKLVVNGDYVKWGDTNCGTIVDPENWIYVWEKPVAPVYPLADEAMIDPSEILYWVGEGDNEVVFAVNFAEPEDVCYAWGYRFSTDDVTIKVMMEAIAAADGRFAFNDAPSSWGGYALTDLTFNYEGKQFVLQGYNAMYNVNGVPSWYTFDEQAVIKGDFVKWGDYTIGTEIAPWTYVWETPVQPVAAYNTVVENNAVMSLYPNPATSYTMLEVNAQDATVTVSDLQGRVLRNFVVSRTNEPIRIELEGFQAGLYFVTVSDGASCQTVKLSVK